MKQDKLLWELRHADTETARKIMELCPPDWNADAVFADAYQKFQGKSISPFMQHLRRIWRKVISCWGISAASVCMTAACLLLTCGTIGLTVLLHRAAPEPAVIMEQTTPNIQTTASIQTSVQTTVQTFPVLLTVPPDSEPPVTSLTTTAAISSTAISDTIRPSEEPSTEPVPDELPFTEAAELETVPLIPEETASFPVPEITISTAAIETVSTTEAVQTETLLTETTAAAAEEMPETGFFIRPYQDDSSYQEDSYELIYIPELDAVFPEVSFTLQAEGYTMDDEYIRENGTEKAFLLSKTLCGEAWYRYHVANHQLIPLTIGENPGYLSIRADWPDNAPCQLIWYQSGYVFVMSGQKQYQEQMQMLAAAILPQTDSAS